MCLQKVTKNDTFRTQLYFSSQNSLLLQMPYTSIQELTKPHPHSKIYELYPFIKDDNRKQVQRNTK